MRITRIVAVAAVAATALVATAIPASAHPLLVVFTGLAITSGTWAPASPACGSTPCPDGNSWSFSSTTDVITPDGTIGSGRVSGAGTFTGWCGRSTGSGTFALGTDSGSVNWQSAGTIIVLTGSSPGHTVVAAVVAARAATGTGNCVTAAATKFDVVGTAHVI